MNDSDSTVNARGIDVQIYTSYLPNLSESDQDRYTFRYTITISNKGPDVAQLLRRHWFITDGNGCVEEVEGEGVVGEKPIIHPGEKFSYSSGCVLPTKVGFMQGYYQLVGRNAEIFNTKIPVFLLAVPNALH